VTDGVRTNEWPGVIRIWANDRESALARGDELAKTCAHTLPKLSVPRNYPPLTGVGTARRPSDRRAAVCTAGPGDLSHTDPDGY
jgi:hypothetical protein